MRFAALRATSKSWRPTTCRIISVVFRIICGGAAPVRRARGGEFLRSPFHSTPPTRTRKKSGPASEVLRG
jgi:hypothetical protein